MTKVFLQQVKDISELVEDPSDQPTEDRLYYIYKEFFGGAIQKSNKLITLSKIFFTFEFEIKNINKYKILQYIDTFNSEVPVIKANLKSLNKKLVTIDFKIEYTLNDQDFNVTNLDRDIKFLISSTSAFNLLLENKNPFKEKK